MKKDWPKEYHFIGLMMNDDSWVLCKFYDMTFPIYHGLENNLGFPRLKPIPSQKESGRW
jgi:hypothetical protein